MIEFGYGVTINFAGKIHSPLYVYKDHSFAIDVSVQYPCISHVQYTMLLNIPLENVVKVKLIIFVK